MNSNKTKQGVFGIFSGLLHVDVHILVHHDLSLTETFLAIWIAAEEEHVNARGNALVPDVHSRWYRIGASQLTINEGIDRGTGIVMDCHFE